MNNTIYTIVDDITIKKSAERFGRTFNQQQTMEKADAIMVAVQDANVNTMPKYPTELGMSYDEHLCNYSVMSMPPEDDEDVANIKQLEETTPVLIFEEYTAWLYDNQHLIGALEVITKGPCPICATAMPVEAYVEIDNCEIKILQGDEVTCPACSAEWHIGASLMFQLKHAGEGCECEHHE